MRWRWKWEKEKLSKKLFCFTCNDLTLHTWTIPFASWHSQRVVSRVIFARVASRRCTIENQCEPFRRARSLVRARARERIFIVITGNSPRSASDGFAEILRATTTARCERCKQAYYASAITLCAPLRYAYSSSSNCRRFRKNKGLFDSLDNSRISASRGYVRRVYSDVTIIIADYR